MHGRVKIRSTEEQREIARQEKCKKAKAYRSAMDTILEKRSSGVHDQETLDLTANVLTGNPDVITLWNYRREILLNLQGEDKESYQKLLEKDLNLTEQCLRVNPKSYGSWHHRVWILDNMPTPNWGRELQLCTKYLQLDERNFHCWDYRRIVTSRSDVPDLSEYKYTLEKIETNFSNYSAWHLRSKLLPKIFPDPDKKFPIDESKHKEELELVENAAFTDPNDQSAWFYLRWLLGLTEPKVTIVYAEVKEEIFVVMSKSVKLGSESQCGVQVKVEVNGELIDGTWCYHNGQDQSSVFTFKPKLKIQPTDTITLKLEENGRDYKEEKLQPTTPLRNKPNFLPSFTPNLMETLTNQLSSCEQLLELEPDSKWTLLTSIFLMVSVDIDKHKPQIMETLDKLCTIDPLRKGYFLDLRSRIITELAIVQLYKMSRTVFNLTNQNLTRMYHLQYLHETEEINLSNNLLTSECLSQFSVFLNCKCLNLKNNIIKNLSDLPIMPKLEVLLLDNNLIEEVNTKHISKFPMLKTVSLINNPVMGKDVDDLITKLSSIKLAFSAS